MSAMSDYLETALVNATLRGTPYTSPATVYMALFTADPGETGATGEVSAASYHRKAVTFRAPNDGTTTNETEIAFDVAVENWGIISHAALFDALTGGNMLYHGALDISKNIEISDQFKMPQDYMIISLK